MTAPLMVLMYLLLFGAAWVAIQVAMADFRRYLARAPRPRPPATQGPCTQCGHLEGEHGLGGDWCRFCPCTGYAQMRHTS